MNIETLAKDFKAQFKQEGHVLSFGEYLRRVEENPKLHLRSASAYAADMMDYFGKSGARFKLFDFPIEGVTQKTSGHERVQNEIYRLLRAFSKGNSPQRLILLHGPNGSAKSTLIQSVQQGLEKYSRSEEGPLYTFSWIFPVDRYVRGGLGLQAKPSETETKISSYAELSDNDIACIIPSELRDSPLLLLPAESRKSWIKSLGIPSHLAGRLASGAPSHRDHLIFEALLKNYQGDIAQVLRHVRVERFFLSRRYRSGVVTIEPQLHVDAHYQQLTLNRSLSQIPTVLQGLNLFSVSGDLVDSNRGLIDYADLLKRPMDTFKYLLTACEQGQVAVGNTIVQLDTVFMGSSNELQLDAFKEYPDFASFKARIELVRVTYLLKLSDELEIYASVLDNLKDEKSISPHTAWTIAFWAVLTRLKKPSRDRYTPELASLVDRITPLDKLYMYETGEIPERFSTEERKLLRGILPQIQEEYGNIPFFEGRSGASARELKSLLIDAAQNPAYKVLSPLAVIQELKKFVKRTGEYEFLRQESIEGYHAFEAFIEVTTVEYIRLIDREIRECLGLYDQKQWADFMKKYVLHVSALLKNEKIKNTITGDYDPPDASLISEFESIVEAPVEPSLKESFRKSLITQIAAWSLDHPGSPVDYFKVFPELRQKIEKHYYEGQKNLLQKMSRALKMFGTEHDDHTDEGSILARQTINNMQQRFGYSEVGAIEVIAFLLNRKYAN